MIKIITTGGTIEGLDYVEDSDRNTTTIHISNLLETAKISIPYKVESAFSKDSRLITSKDRELLLKMIIRTDCNHILITHGTISMVETATYLGRLKLNKTIVLVGSFISGISDSSDASKNLRYAISALQKLSKGVYIAMNEKTFDWHNVRKNTGKNKFEECLE